MLRQSLAGITLLASALMCPMSPFAQTTSGSMPATATATATATAPATAPKPATAATIQANRPVAKSMAFNDAQDNADATRGLVATLPDRQVKTADGKVVWDTTRFDFVQGDAPASVNPSLWRQEKLNNARGLFKVTDGIYQVRGYDIANMTLVEGKTGWIVIDPLLTSEIAKATFAFALKALNSTQSVVAVIYTHTTINNSSGRFALQTF
jgi:alkyl sulfatase BDS1-like metallo-beta-lactamase superfamily hydrolase